jgi:F-type H+-transporting ATPase subunit b
MLIDWFTVGAQAINFLILVWLLRRFLYGPIVQAMNTRQERIAAQLRDAAQRTASLETVAQRLKNDRDAFDKERQQVLDRAADEAAALRRRLTDEVRRDVDSLRTKWTDTLHAEQRQTRDRMIEALQQESLATARSVLTALAGRDLEQTIVDAFLRRLAGLAPDERDALAALATNAAPLVVRSAFDLDDASRARIDAAVGAAFGATAACRFERADELVCGIELLGGGHKVAWSIDDALKSLEDGVRALDGSAAP